MKQATDQRRFAVVHAAARQEPEQILLLMGLDVRIDAGRLERRMHEPRLVWHQKYPSRFFCSMEPDWSKSITRPSRSERVATSISPMISGSVVAVDSIAPDSG